MKMLKVLILSVLALSLALPVAAMKHLPEERGMALFKDPNFANGKRACNSCHPNGKGLEKAGEKKEFRIMGGKQSSLEEAVNFCIVNAAKGTAIPEDSDEMRDMVAYIKSLGKKRAPGYGESPGYR